MKKFWLLLVGVIAVSVLLSNLGSMVGLAICAVVAYFSLKEYKKSDSTFAKVLWGIVIGIAGLSAIFNLPAIVGVAALYVLYVVVKKWNQSSPGVKSSNDPFSSFEKQWNDLTKSS